MSRRIVVTRGDRFDVAEWVEVSGFDEPGAAPPTASPPKGGASTLGVGVAIALALAGALGLAYYVFLKDPVKQVRPLAPTAADLLAVHAGVTIVSEGGGDPRDVRRLERLVVGDKVITDGDGRARLRLDRGAAVVLDRGTELRVSETGIALEKGRIFVEATLGAKVEVDLGGAVALANGVTTGIERPASDPSGARVYAANGELVVRADGEHAVSAGETAVVSGKTVKVEPERGFDDWTGGMAAPWSPVGPPRRALGELWGRTTSAAPGSIGSPLTVRAHEVEATIRGEVARTEVKSTFFNAGSDPVNGDFRMAVPPGAIVAGFATVRDGARKAGRVSLASRTAVSPVPTTDVLEWAGEGWLRGSLPNIASGATVTVHVEYVEWLDPEPRDESRVVQYRYPMVGEGDPPIIGELFARVDATPSRPLSIGAGLGAKVSGAVVELRRSDFRPSADLVVDVEIPAWPAPAPPSPSEGSARLYHAPATGDDPAGKTVLIRAELPAPKQPPGITLAVVLDTSASTEPALLDAARGLVEALVSGLGDEDRIVVLGADSSARPIGPDALGPADAARRGAIHEALGDIAVGGATDLGRALEHAADLLPSDAPEAMVIYVGDGWPTVGDQRVEAIQARLSRRAAGAPRLGAVAVGPVANRSALSALVRGSGPMLEMSDRTDAARVAVELMTDALRPTIAGVEVDLGPEVERVYPRGARAIAVGDTVTVVGRARGDLPREIVLRWREGAELREEKRALVEIEPFDEEDLVRRWADARVAEIAVTGKGREAATDVALRAGLMTPWTAWVVGGPPEYAATPLSIRVLDLASGPSAGFAASMATPRRVFGTIQAFDDASLWLETGGEATGALEAATASAAARALREADGAVRACRDARAALRPELSGTLGCSFEVDADGSAKDVVVRGGPTADDEALLRCVEVVIQGLRYPAMGVSVKVDVDIDLPDPAPSLRGHTCSATSTLPLPLRRGVWRERLDQDGSAQVFIEAKRSCELPTWSARRSLLELIIDKGDALGARGALQDLAVARELSRAGEGDAAAFLRKEAVRRAQTPDELMIVRGQLLRDESLPVEAFRKAYLAAANDEERLRVVQRFLDLAPHDPRLARRKLALLEALGNTEALIEEVRRVRLDPFVDAGLLADAASALQRAGRTDEALRAFGELAERAPADPWARALMGDRLSNEGLFDEATEAYAALETLVPDDPAFVTRLALAHAGAGRLDIAERMLARVAQTGGRSASASFSELAELVARVLVTEAQGREGLSELERSLLERVALDLPRPPAMTAVLVRGPAGAIPIVAQLARGEGPDEERHDPRSRAPTLGLAYLGIDRTDARDVAIVLSRPKGLAPDQPTRARLDALAHESGDDPARLVSTTVELPIDGREVRVPWTGTSWGEPEIAPIRANPAP